MRLLSLLTSIDQAPTIDLDKVRAESQGVARLLRAVRAHAASPRSAARRPSAASSAGRSTRSTSSLLVHERELEVLRTLDELPDVVALACVDRAPHKVTTWVRELADRFHGFYHDCYVIGDGAAGAHPGAPLARRGRPHRARHRSRPARGVARPRRCERDVAGRCRGTCCPTPRRSATDGRLRSAAATCSTLAAEHGTPLFVYDEAHLRARCREAVAAFGDGVAYATKAFLCLAMARLAHEEGMHLDVATGGELHVALAAGVPADRLVLHGNNKSVEELRRARAAGVGRIVVDSFDELDRLDALHAADGVRAEGAASGSRPGVEAHTHEFVRTGQDDSKFGFGVATGAAARAVARAQDSPAVDLVGVHMHIGSQVFVADFFHAGGRGARAVGPRDRPARALDRRRPRRRLRRGRGGAVDHRVGHGHRARAAATPASPPGSPPSRAGRSSPRPPSPSTRSAPSRTCPASAPTCRSTAACATTRARALRLAATRPSCPRATDADRPAAGDDRRQALRVGRRARARRPGARRPGRRRRPRHPGHRCLRALDGLQLQQGAPPGGGLRAATARPARSSAARPTTTSSATTSSDATTILRASAARAVTSPAHACGGAPTLD